MDPEYPAEQDPLAEPGVYRQPAAKVVNGEPAPQPQHAESTLSPNLRPVPIGEVQAARQFPAEYEAKSPRPRERFLSDSFMEDLSEPAYTRKYMD